MMSFKLIFILCVCVSPIVALLIILPKKRKKANGDKEPTKVENATIPQTEEKIETPKEIKSFESRLNAKSGINLDDYLKNKSKSLKKAKRKEENTDTELFEYFRKSENSNEQNNESKRTYADDIVDLPPEMKAIALLNIFNRIDF